VRTDQLRPVTTAVAVVGAGGRMGAEVCRAVAAADDLDLVAAIDPAHAGDRVRDLVGATASDDLVIGADLDHIAEAGATVVVDFTVVAVARETLRWCAARRIHAVVGTTGFTSADIEALGQSFPAAGPTGAVVAPNFAIGAVLMMRFAELAAPHFATAEVVELHHDAKRDAPSGTSLRTLERMAAAREEAGAGEWGADPTTSEVVPGARGGVGPGGAHVHSVRLRGLVAHQEVLFGGTGETLTIRHDSIDRASFMPGVLLAVRQVAGRRGLTLGLEPLLGL
jgi:4-hydroxy-tetrahydrodipicolinate reductase